MDQPRSKKIFSPLNILYFVLGLIVLFFLLKKIDFSGLIQLILKINPAYLILGGLIYLCKALARAFRFTRVNARSSPRFADMLRLSLASSLASQLLPLKLGEFSYVYLLKREGRSSIPQGLSTLMVIRIFDLLAIALLFIVISLLTRMPGVLSVYFYSILIFVGVLLLLIVALLIASRKSDPVLAFFARLPKLSQWMLYQKLLNAVAGVFNDLKQYQWRDYAAWTLIATLEWWINFWTYHVILVGIGLQPAYFDTVVAVTFAALASVLPINSFGNFGTQEAGWATGLVLLGYTQEVAIASGFATHLLTLGYMLVFGGLAWLSYLFIGKTVAQQPAK